MSNIKGVEIIDLEDPLRWRADTRLFLDRYPKEYKAFEDLKIHDPDRNEKELVLEIFEDDEDKLWKVAEQQPSILIRLINGQKEYISNLAIHKIHSGYVESMNVSFEDRFVYCYLIRATDQAGSIGIWDTEINNWCFSYSEDYCFESVKYNRWGDIFLGSYSWNIPLNGGGVGKFLITKERDYIDMESEAEQIKAQKIVRKIPFNTDIVRPVMNDRELSILNKYGTWLLGLYEGDLVPTNTNQKEFIKAMKMEIPPEDEIFKLFWIYLKRRKIQTDRGLNNAKQLIKDDREDWKKIRRSRY